MSRTLKETNQEVIWEIIDLIKCYCTNSLRNVQICLETFENWKSCKGLSSDFVSCVELLKKHLHLRVILFDVVETSGDFTVRGYVLYCSSVIFALKSVKSSLLFDINSKIRYEARETFSQWNMGCNYCTFCTDAFEFSREVKYKVSGTWIIKYAFVYAVLLSFSNFSPFFYSLPVYQ